MATEGEEDWLYGNDKKADEPPAPGTEASETPSQLSADATPFQPKEESTVGADGADGAGEGEGEDKEEDESAVLDEDDEEDDDSDDDVQVTIGAIKTQASYDTPKFKGGYQRPVGQQGPKPAATKGVDVEAVGSVNGVPLFEFDLDSVEDKPWRKPGADITDYFNYGFTEDTWSKYSEKQRRLRIENNATGVQVFVNNPDRHSRGGGPRHPFHRHEYKPPGSTPDSHKPYFKPKYESPIHSQPTTINVIGSTNRDTRRPFQQEFDMDIKESNSYGNPSQTPPPPGVPDAFTRPPPHVHVSEAPPSSIPVMIPPVSMAGQAISVAGVAPVSITSQLPPQMVPTVTGYTGLPPTSVPPPGMGPPPNMQGPPPGMIGPPPGMIGPPPGFGPPPQTNMPPPGFPGGPPPQAFGPPPGSMGGPPLRGPPPGGFPGERPPFNSFPPPGGGGHPRFGGPPPWERGRKERDWMDLPLSDDDLSPGSDDDRKRRRKHDRDRDRDRRRRSRSRDRERRHRDDRHSRSRRN